ncbi:hypothetical protein TB2_023398 [Malus domestica]
MVDRTSYCEKQVNQQHCSSQLPVVTFQHTSNIAVAASKPATTLQPSSSNSPLVGGSGQKFTFAAYPNAPTGLCLHLPNASSQYYISSCRRSLGSEARSENKMCFDYKCKEPDLINGYIWDLSLHRLIRSFIVVSAFISSFVKSTN